MSLTKHCHACGWVWALPTRPSRTETCHQCSTDMRVCLNCVHYEPRVAHQCKERRAEPVDSKDMSNFCEHFDFIRKEYISKDGDNSREQKARDAFNKLFGD